jgi:DNA-binding CsgD family transcriptional regulator
MNARRGSGLPDVTPLLEACYAQGPTHERWGADVVGAFGEAFPFVQGVTLSVIRCDAASDSVAPVMTAGPMSSVKLFMQSCARWSLGALRPYFYPPRIVNMLAEAERRVGSEVRAFMQERLSGLAIQGGLALVVHPTPGEKLVVWGELGENVVVSRHDRGRLARIALHLESAFRLRTNDGAVRAVMTCEGELVDGDLTGVERGRYAMAARGAESTRRTRDLSLWTALVAGELSIVPRMRGSRRVYALVENSREARSFHALSRREVDVLELAATGLTTKLCSYALGLSSSTISTTLRNAASKLGATTQLELLRIAALLARDPRAEADAATLTRAEREILALVREGLSNTEIAARRGRSVRTIANQVASLIEKTGTSSRRALIAATS